MKLTKRKAAEFVRRREALNLSRGVLAVLAGFTEITICRMETANRTSKRVVSQIDGLLFLFERDRTAIHALMGRKNSG